MVRFFIFLLLLLPLSVYASPSLSLLLEQDKQQLGWAFNAQLIASGIDKKLSGIDLSPLERDFGVIVKEYSGVAASKKVASQQRLSIELYPRRTGILHVPVLVFSGATSTTADVEVLQARNSSGPIELEYQLSTTQAWQRQQVLFTLKVITPDRFARLETVDISRGNNEVRHIPGSTTSDDTSTHLQTGWAIFPMQSGLQKISLPPVLYHLQGVVERRFYLPDVQLNIKPLPDYIPPLMPVGKVYVNASINSTEPLSTGTTYNWNVRVYSPALLSHLLPPVLRQISSNDNIHYLPAETRRAENITNSGSHGEINYTIPFQTLATGKLTFPDLRIQYFDPELGRVSIAEFPPMRAWSIATYWQLLFFVVLLFGSIFILKTTWNYWLRLRKRHKYFKEAIHHITNATTNLQLRQALPLIARAENWPDNLSLNAWSGYWNKHYSPSVSSTIEELCYACYSAHGSDVTRIKNNLLRIIGNRKSIQPRFFFVAG